MINYVVGDATDPQTDQPWIIAHICNDMGGWGSGFVLPLARRYPKAESSYRTWYRRKTTTIRPPFELGQVQFVVVDDQRIIANMIGQHGIHVRGGKVPIDYGAVSKALVRVSAYARSMGAEVHMPRIGCGLAGGKWEKIEPIIQATLVLNDVPVFVYDMPDKKAKCPTCHGRGELVSDDSFHFDFGDDHVTPCPDCQAPGPTSLRS